jgi:molecular chaperone HscB
LPGDVDYFSVMELPAHPAIDSQTLTARYYELSRRLHPDRYQTGTPGEQQASVRATAVLNAAFRTLRDVESRGRYWLERTGEKLGRNNPALAPGLAAYVFEAQEKIADLRHAEGSAKETPRGELARTEGELRDHVAKRRSELDALLRGWPEDNHPSTPIAQSQADLKERLSELSYLHTLARDVRAALEE